MNKELKFFPIYLSKYISDRVYKDPSIINLSIGEPYFNPPEKLYQNLRNYLFKTNDYHNIPNKYSESKGSFNLRKEIALRYERLYSAAIDPATEILITHGAAEAIWLSILTLTSEGDEVIIPDPSYTLYETAVKLLGRIAVKLPTQAEFGFCIEIDSLRSMINVNTKLLIINSPENPTGAIYNKDLIKKIHHLAKEKNFYFIHDEVYDSFIFREKHQNFFKYQSRVDATAILINSFSKRFSMMGWRLGWLVGDKEFIDNATKIHTNLTLNLGSLHQEAAATIVNDMAVEKQSMQHVKQIEKNMQNLTNAISNCPGFDLSFGMPNAGFFLFPNISGLYQRLPPEYKVYSTKGEAVMEYLLKECKIAVVPGYIYGKMGNDCIRIVAAIEHEKAEEAGRRLLHLAGQLNTAGV